MTLSRVLEHFVAQQDDITRFLQQYRHLKVPEAENDLDGPVVDVVGQGTHREITDSAPHKEKYQLVDDAGSQSARDSVSTPLVSETTADDSSRPLIRDTDVQEDSLITTDSITTDTVILKDLTQEDSLTTTGADTETLATVWRDVVQEDLITTTDSTDLIRLSDAERDSTDALTTDTVQGSTDSLRLANLNEKTANFALADENSPTDLQDGAGDPLKKDFDDSTATTDTITAKYFELENDPLTTLIPDNLKSFSDEYETTTDAVTAKNLDFEDSPTYMLAEIIAKFQIPASEASAEDDSPSSNTQDDSTDGKILADELLTTDSNQDSTGIRAFEDEPTTTEFVQEFFGLKNFDQLNVEDSKVLADSNDDKLLADELLTTDSNQDSTGIKALDEEPTTTEFVQDSFGLKNFDQLNVEDSKVSADDVTTTEFVSDDSSVAKVFNDPASLDSVQDTTETDSVTVEAAGSHEEPSSSSSPNTQSTTEGSPLGVDTDLDSITIEIAGSEEEKSAALSVSKVQGAADQPCTRSIDFKCHGSTQQVLGNSQSLTEPYFFFYLFCCLKNYSRIVNNDIWLPCFFLPLVTDTDRFDGSLSRNNKAPNRWRDDR
jgi:hypothetical protein